MLWVRALSTVAAILASLAAGEDSCPAGAGQSHACRAAPDTKRGGTAKADMEVHASADLITQEVDQLKAYVHICEERIDLLTELKDVVKSGVNLSLPESHMKLLKEQLPLLSEVASNPDTQPTASADDYVISKTIIPQDGAVSFIKIFPMRSPRSSGSGNSPAAASQTSMPTALIVAGQADGQVRLFTATGELVLAFSAGHDHPVVNIAVSPSHDEYFVATSDAGGIIRVHKINVRQRRLTKGDKQSRRNSTDEKVSQFLGTQINVTSQFTKQMQVPAGSEGAVPKLTTLAVASQAGTKYFVAGDADGKIHVFTRNGTFSATLDAMSTPGTQVEGLYGHLSSLIFYGGDEWGYVDLNRKEVIHTECPDFEGHVKAVAVDSQTPTRLLAADQDGTVWVFNMKEKRNCKVEGHFPKGATVSPISLGSVRGFTIALEQAERGDDAASVMALNMSHVGRKGLPSPIVWRKGRGSVRDWAVQKRYQQGDLLVFLSADGHEIEVAELLMQVYTAPSNNSDAFGNFKMPAIAVAVALVLGYQYMKNKGGKGGGGGKFGKGGGGDGGGFDFSSLKGNKKGLGGLSKLAGLKNRRR